MKSLLGRGGMGRMHPRVIRKVPFPYCTPLSLSSRDRAGCVSCLNSIYARAGTANYGDGAWNAMQVGSGIKQGCPRCLGTQMRGVPLRGQQKMAQASACKGTSTLQGALLGLARCVITGVVVF